MKFCTVIVTYNRLNLLKECLAHAKEQNGIENHIVVYNNASTDATTDYLDSLADPNITVVNGEENLGGAGGFYEAMKFAHQNIVFDWMAIIDDDAMMSSNYLAEIERYSNRFPSVYAFSGTVYVNGSICFGHRSRMKLGKNVLSRAQDYDKEFFEYDLSSFCGLCIKKSVIDAIGLHDKDLFIFFDDSDYCFKIRRISKIVNINAISIDHKTKAPAKLAKYTWRNYYEIRNGVLVFSRNKKHLYAWILIYRAVRDLIKMNLKEKSADQRRYNRKCVKDAMADARKKKEGKNLAYLP